MAHNTPPFEADVDALTTDPTHRSTAHSTQGTSLSQKSILSAPSSADPGNTTVLALSQQFHTDTFYNFVDSRGLKSFNTITDIPSVQLSSTRKRGRPRKAMKDTAENNNYPVKAVTVDNHNAGQTDMVVPGPVNKTRKHNMRTAGPYNAKRAKPCKKGKVVVKDTDDEPARHRIPLDLWQRILEFCPTKFLLTKARLINKTFRTIVDSRTALVVTCRLENYGFDMPSCPEGLTERQYNDLLGGKGCMNPGCSDKRAEKTYWSWNKRWCLKCCKAQMARETDVKQDLSRLMIQPTHIDSLLECIPWALRDSWGQVAPLVEDASDARPGVRKVFRKAEVEKITIDYKALTPLPYKEDPKASDQEKRDAKAAYDQRVANLPQAKSDFFKTRKASNKIFMTKAFDIERHVIARMRKIKEQNDANRAGRKELYLHRAAAELPHIPADFIIKTKCYKAACRIFRNAGTERGWKELENKIYLEWEGSHNAQSNCVSTVAGSTANGEEKEVTSLESDNNEEPASRQACLLEVSHHDASDHEEDLIDRTSTVLDEDVTWNDVYQVSESLSSQSSSSYSASIDAMGLDDRLYDYCAIGKPNDSKPAKPSSSGDTPVTEMLTNAEGPAADDLSLPSTLEDFPGRAPNGMQQKTVSKNESVLLVAVLTSEFCGNYKVFERSSPSIDVSSKGLPQSASRTFLNDEFPSTRTTALKPIARSCGPVIQTTLLDRPDISNPIQLDPLAMDLVQRLPEQSFWDREDADTKPAKRCHIRDGLDTVEVTHMGIKHSGEQDTGDVIGGSNKMSLFARASHFTPPSSSSAPSMGSVGEVLYRTSESAPYTLQYATVPFYPSAGGRVQCSSTSSYDLYRKATN
ncbi:MAG: hypothetical protein M1818_004166 [Claussenomyces sp. TS43310]|nr:MAG: hypothetical protein M1818_004166 [Claussenomyces sp. TS43310]